MTEVKNGKVVFNETKVNHAGATYGMKGYLPEACLARSELTLSRAETLAFMEFRKTQTETPVTFPEQFLPLIGILVQDKYAERCHCYLKQVTHPVLRLLQSDNQGSPRQGDPQDALSQRGRGFSRS